MPTSDHASPRGGYRPDIDGLRAVAVLLVLADHLKLFLLGGYVGVDVFFVISGYLISAHILAEMQAGRFSLANFYERRVRRILPALFVVLAATTVMAYRFDMPSGLVAYGQQMLAALFSYSNILFWSQAGYFDGPSLTKPLLHTWSLAVEEQFYLFFPLLLMVVRRWFPKAIKATILSIAAVSFVASYICMKRSMPTAFFWAPLRAWELLLGAIVSQRYLPALRSRVAREAGAGLGLLLILVPAWKYTAATPFPGVTALLPCVGAALFIAAGEYGASFTGKLLSLKPVVFIGLISYSLYLWHWPLIVFQLNHSAFLDRPPFPLLGTTKLFLLGVSLVMATLSWAFVERPFRQGRFRPSKKTLFAITGVAAALLLATSLGIVKAHGIPSRFTPEEISISASEDPNNFPMPQYRKGVCFVERLSDFQHSTCLPEQPGKKQYLLVGDSTAAQLYWGLSHVFPAIDWQQATMDNCPSFVDDDAIAKRGAGSECLAMNHFLFQDYLLHKHPDAVLVSGNWHDSDMTNLEHTVAWLKAHGFRVILFGPHISFQEPVADIIFRVLHRHDMQAIPRNEVPAQRLLHLKMKQLASEWQVEYVSQFDDLCDHQTASQLQTSDGCPLLAAPGVPIAWDKYHLTAEGSVLFANAMKSKHQIP